MPGGFLNPNSVSFTHKQFDALPVGFLIAHTYGEVPVIHEKPNWLDFYDVTATNFKVRLNSNADTLSPGTINDVLKVKNNVTVNGDGFKEDFEIISTLNISLVLTATQLLSVSPSSLNFTAETGSSTAITKTFSIASESNWSLSKNASWLSLSATNGSNNGTISVSVNPTGLAPQVHTDTITITEGSNTKTVAISFTISDGNTSSDYVNVFPTELNFEFTKNGALPNAKNLAINASGNFTITKSQSWITVASSGVSGNQSIPVSFNNLNVLNAGAYIGYIDITLGTIVKRITINLTVYELVIEKLTSGELYYSDDNNLVKVSSSRSLSYLEILVASSFEGKSYNLPYKVPFFNGFAKKRIGKSVRSIIGEREFFNTSIKRMINGYAPLQMNLIINEVSVDENKVIQTVTTNGVKFLKGVKPPTNLLSYIPKTIFLTPKGVLLFSVLANGNSSGDLVLSGAINETLSGVQSVSEFYTVILPLSEYDLNVGDSFTATLLNETIKVFIRSENLESTMLYAETTWGTYEGFELTGELTEIANFKSEKFKFQKDHLTNETKTLEVKETVSYKVNTGYIFTDDLVVYLKTLLKSTNFYLKTNKGVFKVTNTTRNLSIYKSLAESKSADLTFKSVLEW